MRDRRATHTEQIDLRKIYKLYTTLGATGTGTYYHDPG
jgi:hypothetical protein